MGFGLPRARAGENESTTARARPVARNAPLDQPTGVELTIADLRARAWAELDRVSSLQAPGPYRAAMRALAAGDPGAGARVVDELRARPGLWPSLRAALEAWSRPRSS